MKFFLDTANTEEIKPLLSSGLIDGVTTNPSLIAKSKKDFKTVVAEIADMVDGPVSAEVVATDVKGMLSEADILTQIAENIVIKLPLTMNGLTACRSLTSQGVKTNVTLCFSPTQALLAAKAGATYISPFIGRLDDTHLNGMTLISEIRQIYDNYHFDTQILAASIRNTNHIKEAAMIGADVATMPANLIAQLASHPLTDKGLEMFLADWNKSDLTI